jgi:hypothetical protein
MKTSRISTLLTTLGLAATLPFTMGARGDGCAAASNSPAPDMAGSWDISYDDSLAVEIKIGGSVYNETLGPQGGVVSITHDGHPLTFDLDCEKPEILCPSEAWPDTVSIEHRNLRKEHQMIVTLPIQSCDGSLVAPADDECGPGTLNEECDLVCDGTMTVRNEERFGVIGEAGESFRLYLGAGIATNGINCALLAFSVADANLVTAGERGSEDWLATSMTDGTVDVGYAGGCLWAGDPDMDGQVEALVLGASIKFTTGFTGERSANF